MQEVRRYTFNNMAAIIFIKFGEMMFYLAVFIFDTGQCWSSFLYIFLHILFPEGYANCSPITRTLSSLHPYLSRKPCFGTLQHLSRLLIFGFLLPEWLAIVSKSQEPYFLYAYGSVEIKRCFDIFWHWSVLLYFYLFYFLKGYGSCSRVTRTIFSSHFCIDHLICTMFAMATSM